jgi:hypothetical protein
VKHTLHDIRKAIASAGHKLFLKIAVASHFAYYGLVAMEAHGFYRYASGIIVLVMVVEAIEARVSGGPTA